MKIDRLFIEGFGRLSDLKIDFAPRINIVYGRNESGKSTLHSFIEQMFYHGYKTGYKNRQLEAPLERYKPWGKAAYSGSLTLTDDGQRTIEKDFSYKYAKLNVYDAAGNEVSSEYPSDDVFREPQVGLKHFGLSKIMFKNSVSVGQIGKQTDQQAVAEIKRYVGNIEKTNDATISVQNVKAKLAAERERIGRKSKKKSNYGRREARLAELASARQRALQLNDELAQLQRQLGQIDGDIASAATELRQIDAQLAAVRQREDNLLKQKADQLVAEIEQLNKSVAQLKRYRAFNYQVVSQLNQLKSEIEKTEVDRQHCQRDCAVLQQQDQAVDASSAELDLAALQGTRADLKERQNALKKLAEQAAELNRQSEQLQLIDALSDEVKAPPQWPYWAAILAALASVIFTFKYNIYLAAVAALTLLPSGLLLLNRRNKRAASAKKRVENGEQLERLKAELAKNEAAAQHILEAVKLTDSAQLDDRIGELNGDINLAKWQAAEAAKRARQSAARKAEIEQRTEQLKRLQEALEQLQKKRNALFEQLDIASFDVVDEQHAKQRQLCEVERARDHQRELLDEILAGRNYADLKYVDVAEAVDISQKPALRAARLQAERRHSARQADRGQLVQQINRLQQGGRSLQSIEEETEQLLKARAADDVRLKVLDVIAAKIDLAIDNVQRTVMPEVNRTVGQIVALATAGKYDDIKVNGELGVFIGDKSTGKTIALEQLSAGTIDLLYIALRIAVAALLNDNKAVPLLFDDSFAQIDDVRLTNLLKFLAGLDRQIIIFTCQQRERDILDQLNLPYQIIEL